MTLRQLARCAATLHNLAEIAERNHTFAIATHLREAEAIVHSAAGASSLAVIANIEAALSRAKIQD